MYCTHPASRRIHILQDFLYTRYRVCQLHGHLTNCFVRAACDGGLWPTRDVTAGRRGGQATPRFPISPLPPRPAARRRAKRPRAARRAAAAAARALRVARLTATQHTRAASIALFAAVNEMDVAASAEGAAVVDAVEVVLEKEEEAAEEDAEEAAEAEAEAEAEAVVPHGK